MKSKNTKKARGKICISQGAATIKKHYAYSVNIFQIPIIYSQSFIHNSNFHTFLEKWGANKGAKKTYGGHGPP